MLPGPEIVEFFSVRERRPDARAQRQLSVCTVVQAESSMILYLVHDHVVQSAAHVGTRPIDDCEHFISLGGPGQRELSVFLFLLWSAPCKLQGSNTRAFGGVCGEKTLQGKSARSRSLPNFRFGLNELQPSRELHRTWMSTISKTEILVCFR